MAATSEIGTGNDMNKDLEYFVDDKPFSIAKPELTVVEILTRAEVSIRQFYLVSADGTEYRDLNKTIKMHPNDRFETKKRTDTRSASNTYTVNGEIQTTDRHSLAVETILKTAGAAASIDATQISSYFLENLADGRKYENLADQVAIQDGDKFLAVHMGRTPVA